MHFYPGFCSALFLIFGLGCLAERLHCIRCQDELARLFFRMLGGLVTLTTVVAIYSTGSVTTTWFFFAIGLALRGPFRDPRSTPGATISRSTLLAGFSIASLVFGFSCIMASGFPGRTLFYLDEYYYAAAGNALVETGTETYRGYLQPFLSQKLEPIPYHYFDLWTQASMSLLGGRDSAMAVKLHLTDPVLWTICLVGFAALLRETMPRSYRQPIIWTASAMAVWLSGPDISPFLSHRWVGYFMPYTNILTTPKLSPNVLFLLAFSILSLQGRMTQSLVVALGCSICSATAWPGTFGAVTVLGATAYFHKAFTPRVGFQIFMAGLALAIGLVGFYGFLGQLGARVETAIVLWPFLAAPTKAVVSAIPTMATVVLLLSLGGRLCPRERWLIVGLILPPAIGSLGWALTYQAADSVQLFTNLAFAAGSVLQVWAIGRIYRVKPRSALLALLCLLAISVPRTHPHGETRPMTVASAFLMDIAEMTTDLKGPVAVAVLNRPPDVHSFYFANTCLHALEDASFLLSDPRVRIVSVGDLEYPVSTDPKIGAIEKSILSTQPFFNFSTQTKVESDQIILAYLRRAGIEFLLYKDESLLPRSISERITDQRTDPGTGWRFARVTLAADSPTRPK